MRFSRSGFRRYLGNTGWLVAGQAYSMLIGLAVTVVVARYLGPGGFGQLNFYWSLVVMLGVLGNLGIPPILYRELVKSPDSRNRLLGTSVVFMTFAGALLFFGFALAGLLFDPGSGPLWLMLLMGLTLLLNPFKCIEIWFQSRVRSRLPVIATALAITLSGTVKIVLVLLDAGLPWFGWAYFVEAVAAAVFLLLFYHDQGGSVRDWLPDPRMGRELLRNSWPLLLSAVSVAIYQKIDFVMLSRIAGDAALGEYAAATRLSTIWFTIPVLLARSLFPALVRFRFHEPAVYGLRMQQYFDLGALISFCILIPVFLLAPWIVEIVFGGAYTGGGAILRVHIFSIFFIFMGSALTQAYIAEGWTGILLVSNAAGAAVNIMANFLLIPLFAGYGAAWATIISLATTSVIASTVFPKTRSFGFMQVRALFVLLRLPQIRNRPNG